MGLLGELGLCPCPHLLLEGHPDQAGGRLVDPCCHHSVLEELNPLLLGGSCLGELALQWQLLQQLQGKGTR